MEVSCLAHSYTMTGVASEPLKSLSEDPLDPQPPRLGRKHLMSDLAISVCSRHVKLACFGGQSVALKSSPPAAFKPEVVLLNLNVRFERSLMSHLRSK